MPATYPIAQPAELLPFLFACRPEVKRTKLRQWLKLGMVEVNGQPVVHGNHPLAVGDVVSIRETPIARATHRLPAGLVLRFEDDALLVIEKPHNLLSMATDLEREKTAYAYLTDYVRRGRPQSRQRVWIVHRLDRETSGLMIFAKTEEVQRRLQSHWYETAKRYLAVVEGLPVEDAGSLRSYLDETQPHKVFSGRECDQTRLAVTHYRVLKRGTERALVELTLETGRRNQIRVQLADLGHPILGDLKYGARTNPARRLALHAAFLAFVHPTTGEHMTFESPPPGPIARLV